MQFHGFRTNADVAPTLTDHSGVAVAEGFESVILLDGNDETYYELWKQNHSPWLTDTVTAPLDAFPVEINPACVTGFAVTARLSTPIMGMGTDGGVSFRLHVPSEFWPKPHNDIVLTRDAARDDSQRWLQAAPGDPVTRSNLDTTLYDEAYVKWATGNRHPDAFKSLMAAWAAGAVSVVFSPSRNPYADDWTESAPVAARIHDLIFHIHYIETRYDVPVYARSQTILTSVTQRGVYPWEGYEDLVWGPRPDLVHYCFLHWEQQTDDPEITPPVIDKARAPLSPLPPIEVDPPAIFALRVCADVAADSTSEAIGGDLNARLEVGVRNGDAWGFAAELIVPAHGNAITYKTDKIYPPYHDAPTLAYDLANGNCELWAEIIPVQQVTNFPANIQAWFYTVWIEVDYGCDAVITIPDWSRRPFVRLFPRDDKYMGSPRIHPLPSSQQTPGRITGYQ